MAAAFAAGLLVVLLWRRGEPTLPVVIGLALAFRLAVAWLPPILSDDLYRYVWDGLVQAEGYNPYRYTPNEPELAHLQEEPIFEVLNSADYHSVYPPLSQLIFRIGALFYDHGWQVSAYVIKGILALMEFGAVLVLARMLSPAQLMLYAWNPAVILAGAGQAHGEAALALCLSLCLLASTRKKGMQAAVWLALAGWVKLYPFVLFPFLWRRFGWRSMAAGGGITLVVAIPFLDPTVLPNVFESLNLYVRLFEFNAGPYYAIKHLLLALTGMDWSKQLGPAFGILYLIVLGLLYRLDRRDGWDLRRTFAWAVGAFFLCATTLHPWYLLGILVLVAPAARPAWHWHWLSVLSIGTYLLYSDDIYWIWVVLGWGGWMAFAVSRYGRDASAVIRRTRMGGILLDWIDRRLQTCLDRILCARASRKAGVLARELSSGWSVLDVGAGEGFTGMHLAARLGGEVKGVDVIRMNRTAMPVRLYDGRRIPHADRAFDAVVLVYVLHHAEDAERVVREALRVSRYRVVILESTFAWAWERPVLRWLDRTANAIRSGGRMRDQDPHLHFRRHEEWLTLFQGLPTTRVRHKRLGGFIHHRSLFVLEGVASP